MREEKGEKSSDYIARECGKAEGFKLSVLGTVHGRGGHKP